MDKNMDKATMNEKISRAAEWIRDSKHTTVFTGAGISVESGIPPFRGEGGLWNKYDPNMLDISYFLSQPETCWGVIKEIFYDFFGKAKPNDAHIGIAELEKEGYVKAVITQNIDNLHQEGGSKIVHEFHGTSAYLRCMTCEAVYASKTVSLATMPPKCKGCSGILKPDFIFFGEGIPRDVSIQSFGEAQLADVFLVIGTTGEVMPACDIPFQAKKRGAKIIEINMDPSSFTHSITDIFLQGKATEMMNRITEEIKSGAGPKKPLP
jgi:NAD-dependent protein deacetylase/lipoamidase